MADFFKAEPITGAAEGKAWSKVPGDRGGETLCGVTRKYFPDWRIWTYIDRCKRHPEFPNNIDFKGLKPHLHEFYKTEFWDKLKGDEMPNQHQANLLYDVAVNMGLGYSSRNLQRALNSMNRQQKDYPDISEDGAIGRGTLSALSSLYRLRKLKGELSLMFGFYCMCGAHWYEIADKDESQEKFINGWYWRGVKNIYYIALDYISRGFKI